MKNNIITFVSLIKQNKMKYNELHRILKKAGCYDTGRTMEGTHYGTVRLRTSISEQATMVLKK